jgi:hypothetical protein
MSRRADELLLLMPAASSGPSGLHTARSSRELAGFVSVFGGGNPCKGRRVVRRGNPSLLDREARERAR